MHRVLAREEGAARKKEITEKCKKVYEVLDWLHNHEPAAFERVADWAIPLAHVLADVSSISERARSRLKKARTIMPNDYSRTVGDYAELTIRKEVVEHLQRNMARYTDGTVEWPADFTEWFDFSLARSHTHDDEFEEAYSSDTDDDDDSREALVTD